MKGCFATFLAILVAIVTLVVILAAGLRYSIFDLQYLKAQLLKGDFYEFVANDLVPEMVTEGLNQPDQDASTTDSGIPITNEDIGQIASTVITEESLQTTVETAIDELDAFLQNKKDEPEVVIDLTEYRSTLIDSVIDLLEQKYSALPVCSSAELHAQTTTQEGSGWPECRPSGVDFNEYSSAATGGQDLKTKLTDEVSDSIPNEIDLFHPEEWSGSGEVTAEETAAYEQSAESIRQTLLQFRSIYGQVTLAIFIAIALDAALLIILLVMYTSNLRSGFKWIGIPLMIASTVTFVIALAGNAITGKAILALQEQGSTGGTSPDMAMERIVPLLSSILNGAFLKIELFAGIILGVGILLIILSFVFKKKTATPPSSPAPAPATTHVAPTQPSQPAPTTAAPPPAQTAPTMPAPQLPPAQTTQPAPAAVQQPQPPTYKSTFKPTQN